MKNKLSRNIIGCIWMLGSALIFSVSYLFAKKVGLNIPAFQVAFIRCLFQIVLLMPLVAPKGFGFLASNKIKYYLLRISLGTTNMIIFYYILTKIPMANAIAISYARPIFMVVLAFFMLGEKFGIHRIISTIIGFIGVLILIRPEADGFNPASLLAVFAAFCLTLTHIYIKKLAVTEHPIAMLMWFSIVASFICLPFAAAVWVTPSFYEIMFIFILSALSVFGQYTTIKALFYGEASIVSALDYSQIVFVTFLGFMFFGEIPDFWTYIGAGIIVISSLYILYREQKIKS